MLKAYISRSDSICSVLCVNENDHDECDDAKEICTNNNRTFHLTCEQQSQVNDLLNQFNYLFSYMLDKTDLVVYKI